MFGSKKRNSFDVVKEERSLMIKRKSNLLFDQGFAGFFSPVGVLCFGLFCDLM